MKIDNKEQFSHWWRLLFTYWRESLPNPKKAPKITGFSETTLSFWEMVGRDTPHILTFNFGMNHIADLAGYQFIIHTKDGCKYLINNKGLNELVSIEKLKGLAGANDSVYHWVNRVRNGFEPKKIELDKLFYLLDYIGAKLIWDRKEAIV